MRKAFTLVELLVVIAIISILAALLLPALENAIESGRRITCMNNQKQLFLTAMNYADDFDDRLPPNCKTNWDQPTNWNVDQLDQNGRNGFKAWLHQYVEVPLYNKPKYAGGTPLASPYGVNAYLPTLAAAATLRCPGTTLQSLAPSYTYHSLSDYWMTGFGGCFSAYNAYAYSRRSRVGETYKGERKAFITEHLWGSLVTHRTYFFRNYQGHSPADPKGMNIVAGDGSGSWVPYTPLWPSYYQTRMPVGFYTQWHWMDCGTYKQIYLFTPTGGATYGRSSTNLDYYNKLMKEWY